MVNKSIYAEFLKTPDQYANAFVGSLFILAEILELSTEEMTDLGDLIAATLCFDMSRRTKTLYTMGQRYKRHLIDKYSTVPKGWED